MEQSNEQLQPAAEEEQIYPIAEEEPLQEHGRELVDLEEDLEPEAEEEICEDVGLVSIIVPVYNVERDLPLCVETILKQTYPYFELLLIDDGSTDGSPALCDEFAQQDSRVRVIHKENEGASRTRNRGLEEAKGEYIVFVDSDDKVSSHMLKRMILPMTRYGTDLILSGYARFRDKWKQNFRLSPYSLVIFQSQAELASVYKKPGTNMFGVSIWAKMYKAEIIREHNIRFQEDVHYEEDCLFNLDYFPHVQAAGVIRDYLYFYRQQDTSLSKGYKKTNFPFLLQGYRARKAYVESLGLSSMSLNPILMIVIKTTFTKIFHADMTKEEKLAEYASIMAYEESQAVAQGSLRSKSRLTRSIAKAVVAQDSKRVHNLLALQRYSDKVKSLIKRVLWKLKKRR